MKYLLLFVCCLLLIHQGDACARKSKGKCPEGWTIVGLSCYQAVKVQATTLKMAQDACKKLVPPESHPPAIFDDEDWKSLMGFLLYKSAEYPYDSVKLWLALTAKPNPTHQQWVWMGRAPMNFTIWDTPVPPTILYEPLQPDYHVVKETCGVGWAQRSTQKNGWLNTKCEANPTQGDVITICQRKPDHNRHKPTNIELTVKRVDKAFSNIALRNGTNIRLAVPRSDLEKSNELINKINKLTAKRTYGASHTYLPTASPVKGDNFMSLATLERQYEMLLTQYGESDPEFQNATNTESRRKREIKPAIEKWSVRRNITYQYDGKFPKKGKQWQLFDEAIHYWMTRTCFNFSVSDSPDVIFLDGGGCYSTVGKASYDRPQAISMGEKCETLAIVTHELGHMLGLDHMQNRDKYVEVYLPNVNATYIDNFRPCCDCGTKKPKPYDYGSVMHYAPTEFTVTGGTTLLPKNEDWWHTIGTSHEPSFLDVKLVNDLNCKGFCRNEQQANCQNDGYPHPRNCSKCVCPPGFAGYDCSEFDHKNFKCGGMYDLTENFINISSPNYPAEFQLAECAWIFHAPKGYRIEMKFEKKFFDFPENCYYGYLEVKSHADLTPTGKRMCGNKIPKDVISDSNRMVVIMRTFLNLDNYGFSAKMRAIPLAVLRLRYKRERGKITTLSTRTLPLSTSTATTTPTTTKSLKELRQEGVNFRRPANHSQEHLACAFVSGTVRNAGPAGLTLRADNE